MRKSFLVLGMSLFLAACSEGANQFGAEEAAPQTPDRQMEMPAEKRAQLLPTTLFAAVLNNSLPAARAILERAPEELDAENEEGNTPLGFALTLGLKDMTALLLTATPPAQLTHVNKAGESYVFLAARAGFHEAILWLGGTYGNTLGLPVMYSFATLDPDTQTRQRALFVAANRQVAEALESQYQKDAGGVVKFWLWDFVLRTDTEERNFLHAAAADGRSDVVLWASERLCAVNDVSAPDENAVLHSIGWGWDRFWRGVETYTGFDNWLNEPTAQLFNRQDLHGLTPLHTAIQHRQWKTVRALASCHWLDYGLENTHHDLPLHMFLETINPAVPRLDDETRDTFAFLMRQEPQMRRWIQSVADRVNWRNADGDTALHLAARLADPFFYTALKNYGDVYLLDADGVTAENLFLARQRQVSAYGR
jgi:ankyrin repeat protein